MKLERHICDLCGGTIGPKDVYGKLHAPNFAKVDAPKPPTEPAAEYGFFRMFLAGGPAHDIQEYDVCRGCCEGLLRARDFLQTAKDAFRKEPTR